MMLLTILFMKILKIQHYKPGEGFFKWHTENEGYGNSKLRHLVFMTYLNTVEDAGTEFYHQKITSPAKKGLTLMWPAEWTHTHKGQISKEDEKIYHNRLVQICEIVIWKNI